MKAIQCFYLKRYKTTQQLYKSSLFIAHEPELVSRPCPTRGKVARSVLCTVCLEGEPKGVAENSIYVCHTAQLSTQIHPLNTVTAWENGATTWSKPLRTKTKKIEGQCRAGRLPGEVSLLSVPQWLQEIGPAPINCCSYIREKLLDVNRGCVLLQSQRNGERLAKGHV